MNPDQRHLNLSFADRRRKIDAMLAEMEKGHLAELRLPTGEIVQTGLDAETAQAIRRLRKRAGLDVA